MPDAFFILVGGGCLLAAAVPKPGSAGVVWLRWMSGLALVFAAVGAVAAAMISRAEEAPAIFHRVQAGLVPMTLGGVLLHVLASVTGWLRASRAIGCIGFFVAILAGSHLLHAAMVDLDTAVAFPPKAFSMALQTLSSAGAAAIPGLAVGAALFPLFGVTTPAESAAAYRRLHRGLLLALLLRAILSVGGVLLVAAALGSSQQPVQWQWNLIAARWVLGLIAPVAFAGLAYRRAAVGRALSSAALGLCGAIYAINGEQLALVLVSRTGLPF